LVGRPEGKSLLRRPSRRWEDNITVDLEGVRRDGQVAVDCEFGNEPLGFIKCGEFF